MSARSNRATQVGDGCASVTARTVGEREVAVKRTEPGTDTLRRPLRYEPAQPNGPVTHVRISPCPEVLTGAETSTGRNGRH